MIFRPDRRGRAGPLLEWKVRLFVVGAGLGLTGIFLDNRWLTGVAIAVLAGGALLRLLGRGDGTREEAGSPDGSPDDPAAGDEESRGHP